MTDQIHNDDAGKNGKGEGPVPYEVGYGKPPKHTQFQPKYSGNPGGRKRGSKGLRTDLAEEMAEFVTITENGKKMRVTKQRMVIKSMVRLASQGNVAASDKLIGWMIQGFGYEDRRPASKVLNKEDAAILAKIMGDMAGDADPSDDGAEPEHADA